MSDDVNAILRRAGTGPDAAVDLAETALALAALDRPGVALAWYRQHLAQLSAAVRAEAQGEAGDAHAAAAALRTVLARRYGYAGDVATYDDLQNANLMRVIDRRKGLPVALGIVYLTVARAQGWAIEGLNFPGHFLVRLEQGGERLILDPFNGGIERGPAALREMLKAVADNGAELQPEHYAVIGNRDVLLRLQDNIKLRLLQRDEPERALEVLARMILIAPDRAALWRETGLLRARLGNLNAAIDALERFLAIGGNDQLMHKTAVLLQQLRNRLN